MLSESGFQARENSSQVLLLRILPFKGLNHTFCTPNVVHFGGLVFGNTGKQVAVRTKPHFIYITLMFIADIKEKKLYTVWISEPVRGSQSLMH